MKGRCIIAASCLMLLYSCSAGRYAANPSYPAPETEYDAKGILEEVFYKPSVEGPEERRMLVYLPEDYHRCSDSYPVLYLLHGARGNETSWITQGNLLKNVDWLTERGCMKKTIIVMPNTNQYDDDSDFGHSRRKNAAESVFEMDGSAEYSFIKDVVPTIDSLYRSIPHKSGRAIAGLSIGAVQSACISADRPDWFDYVGIFSPFVNVWAKKSRYSDLYEGLRTKMEVQFADPPDLYLIMSGRNDLFFNRIQRSIRYLERKGYKIEYIPTSGRHTWKNWEAYSCRFMEELWKL